MKQLFQDLAILLAWISCILIFSWILVYFTADIRNASIIRAYNTELKGQESAVSVQQILNTNKRYLLFATSRPSFRALLSPMISPYGVSMNLLFIDASGHADNLYPLGSSSNWMYQRTNPEYINFFIDLWLTNPVIKEKRSK